MMKNKIMLLALMSGFVAMQAVESDATSKLKLGVGLVATTAVAGLVMWRLTAPSDGRILDNIQHKMNGDNLSKYSQDFDLRAISGAQEQQVEENFLTKLQYTHPLNKNAIQAKLLSDEQELKNLKNSIWFRSYFNSDVSKKYNDLSKAELNAQKLFVYTVRHANYFKGYNLWYKDAEFHSKLEQTLNQDFIQCIRKHHLLSKGYPLLVFTAKLISDIQWFQGSKKGVYPNLEQGLTTVVENKTNLAAILLSHHEYQKEKEWEHRDNEEIRKQITADALARSAQATSKQAEIAAQNIQLEKQRLALAREEYERKRIQDRIAALRRSGYSDLQIQRQLDSEAFSRTIIEFFFPR